MTEETQKKATDWDVVERDYRAGIKALRQIADENGITEGAIRKRAKRDEWSRDLTGRIHAKAEELVRKEAVRTVGTQLSPQTEKEVVAANATAIAAADLTNRKDVILGIGISRAQLEELEALGQPEFRERLEWLGRVMDESSTDEKGREIKDKVNELYTYIIGLSGRIKMAKDAAAAIGVYIPMQRKILKLDADADRNQSDVDGVLKRILSGSQ